MLAVLANMNRYSHHQAELCKKVTCGNAHVHAGDKWVGRRHGLHAGCVLQRVCYVEAYVTLQVVTPYSSSSRALHTC